MNRQLIEYQLFGPISSFIGLYKFSDIVLEQYEHYQKMSFRNRFQLLGVNGVQNLSVPLKGGRDKKHGIITEVQINYDGKWQQEQVRTLKTLYNNSPFYYHYEPAVLALFQARFTYLYELCEASLSWTLQQLQWPGELSRSTHFQKVMPEGWEDYRNKCLPKNSTLFNIPAYAQVFGKGFHNNLSILDLLFNLGPMSIDYLQQTVILDSKLY